MKLVLKPLVAALSLTAFTTVMAGTMGAPMPSPAGFSGGLGLAVDSVYSTINVNTYAYLRGAIAAGHAASVELERTLNGEANDTTTGFSPLVQLSYWLEKSDNWFFGPRFVYQYIGQNNHTITNNVYDNSSTNGANSITNPLLEVLPNATLKVKHEFALLAMAGKQMNNFFVYGGVGPAYFLAEFRGSARAHGNYVNNNQGYPKHSDAWEFTKSADTWGGVLTLGTSYFVSNNITVDVTGYLSFAPNKTVTYATAGNFYQSGNNNAGPAVAQANGEFRGKYTNQALAFTVTKYFG